MSRVFWHKAAKADLVRHTVWLEVNASEEVADAFTQYVQESLSLLLAFPFAGTPRSFAHPRLQQLRMWQLRRFEEYLIFYRPTIRGISVVTIVHSKQDFRRVLGR